MPDLDAHISRPLSSQGVQALAISGNSREAISNYLRSVIFHFPTLVDTNPTDEVYLTYSQLATEPASSKYPLNFVIDRQGHIVYSSRQYDRDAIVAAVQQAMGN